MASLLIARRFNGPASSANGGYTSGALAQAAQLPGPTTVRLRRPPPLETLLDVVPTLEGVELRDGETVVAIAVPEGPTTWADTRPVSVDVARGLEASYAGRRHHPFPRCFSCGPDREPGDGLRIFPGRLDEDRVAGSWTPAPSVADHDGVVAPPVAWAALDCVSAWSTDVAERPLVLAQMSARVASPPTVGSSYAAVGTLRRQDGRKMWTASHLFDADGHLVGQAEHLWIEVSLETVEALQS